MNVVKISQHNIGKSQPCFIVAEIGAMYEDLSGMKELIRRCRQAGADAVKLQSYCADKLAVEGAEFEFEDGSRMSQLAFFKKYEINEDDHRELFMFARQQGITIFSTPSHYDDVDFLDELGCPVFKTGSDDLTNYPFLEYIAKKQKPVIVSTGMATLAEVDEAVRTILAAGNEQLMLLHCTVSYPPGPEFANLNIIETLQGAFDLPIGYSDHVDGILPSVLAASMGACMIEKHVTLNRSRKRPDWQVSLEPDELKQMVEQIRLIPVLKGSSVKKVYEPEVKWRRNARKSITAAKDLKAGDVIGRKDIKIMRPGTGIHPQYMDFVVGRKVEKDITANQLITPDCLDG